MHPLARGLDESAGDVDRGGAKVDSVSMHVDQSGSRAPSRCWLWMACATLALVSGCADRTSLLIRVISDDYGVPADIDRLDISVRGMTTGMSVDRSFPITAPWPHTLAVRPGMVESGDVRITVTAFLGDEFVTRRVFDRSFTAGFENAVEIALQESCRGVMCRDGYDCANGVCVNQPRDAGPIDVFFSFDTDPDGGVDTATDAPCPAGYSNCRGTCILPNENPMFCGANLACEGYRTCVGNELCIAGECTLACDLGLVNCRGFCENPQTDRRHCGASLTDCSGGMECPAGQYCALGACTSMCPPGLILCAGNCIDSRSDRTYCGVGEGCVGGAGSCFAGQQCSGGECVTSCPMGQFACGGRCIDPMSDRVYCGARPDCANSTPCASGEVCVDGTCQTSCPAPQISCTGRCVDPATDESFCGAMPDCTGGRICAPGFLCRMGACVANCPAGQIACDGRCVDPATDEAYCGATGEACAGARVCGARQACIGGACGCGAPEEECGGVCVDTRFDPTNCGRCGNSCPPGQVCAGSSCAPLSGGGFTGDFGTSWTVLPLGRGTTCIQEFGARGVTDLYMGHEESFGAWETAPDALRYRPAASPPNRFPANCSFASIAGFLVQISPRVVNGYLTTAMGGFVGDRWRTAEPPSDLGMVGMTVASNDAVWTANATFLLRGNPTEIYLTRTLETIPAGLPAGASLTAPRLTWDQLTGRLYFASQGSRELRSYDPLTRGLRVESTAPANIGAAFCGDRAGHIYVGSQDSPQQLWQYTPASGRWRDLPPIPGTITGTTNCGIMETGTVARTGALYVAARPGTALYRLELPRIDPL